MQIKRQNIDEDTVVFAPCEDIDTGTAPHPQTELEAAISSGKTKIIVDLSDVEYFSSGGLKILVHIHNMLRKKGGRLIVTNANDSIKNIIRLAGLHKVLEIVPTGEEALKLLKDQKSQTSI